MLSILPFKDIMELFLRMDKQDQEKTYTMTGGGDTENGQGIIPRALRYIYYVA